MKPSLAVATLMLAVSSGAQAQSTTGTQVAPPPEGKKICRSEKMTGSLTRVRRICLTDAEWRELALRSRHSLEDAQRDASGGTNSAFDERNAPEAAMAAMNSQNPGSGR
jgi:predicted secreted protein